MKSFLWSARVLLLFFFFLSPAWAANERDRPEPTQASEVQEEIIKVPEKAPESSFQLVFVGTVVSMDPYSHKIVVMDKSGKIRAFYAGSDVISSLAKGMVVQMRIQPGSNKIENFQKING